MPALSDIAWKGRLVMATSGILPPRRTSGTMTGGLASESARPRLRSASSAAVTAFSMDADASDRRGTLLQMTFDGPPKATRSGIQPSSSRSTNSFVSRPPSARRVSLTSVKSLTGSLSARTLFLRFSFSLILSAVERDGG